MLFLLSPAKSLDYDTPAGDVPHTQPLFTRQSQQLIDLLKVKSPQEIAELMSLSDTLAGLNVARYEAWRPNSPPKTRNRPCWPLTAMCTAGWMPKAWGQTRWRGCRTMYAF
jgi:cytoplasmic iron level regulating protein YaaA (DUF328/UPF0246 family)